MSSRDGRRGVQADLAVDEVDRLPVPNDRRCLQINDAGVAEAGDRAAGLRVQRDQPEPGRDVENALVSSVGPVRDTAARQLARCGGAARAFGLAVNPPQFAGRGVERDDGSPCAGGRVDHAIDHQRRAFQLELGPRPRLSVLNRHATSSC